MSPEMPVGFTLVYAPQSNEDIEMVERLISAAALYISGREIQAPDRVEPKSVEADVVIES